MPYDDKFETFGVDAKDGVAWATFDSPPTNFQGRPMLADLNRLAQKREADRVARWPAASINACRQAVYASIDDALNTEAYRLHQATRRTPAIKRFARADETGAQFDMTNQRHGPDLAVKIQDVI